MSAYDDWKTTNPNDDGFDNAMESVKEGWTEELSQQDRVLTNEDIHNIMFDTDYDVINAFGHLSPDELHEAMIDLVILIQVVSTPEWAEYSTTDCEIIENLMHELYPIKKR